MRRYISLITSALVCVSCTMAPKYQRPEAPVSANWPNAKAIEITEETQATLASLYWKDFFLYPELQELIQTVLDHNLSLREAYEKVEVARTLYRIKRNDLFPGAQAEGSGSRKKIPEKASSSGNAYISTSYDANINTTYEIDLFGRLRSLNNAAREDFLSAAENRRAIQVALIAETASVYLSWLIDQKTVRAYQEIESIAVEQLKIAQASLKVGNAVQSDVDMAEAVVWQARNNIEGSKKRVELDQNAMTLLLGVPFNGTAINHENIDVAKIINHDDLPVGLPSEVLVMRPDVLSAEHHLKSLNANIGAVRAAYFPKISLTAAFGFSSTALGSLFSGGAAGAWNFAPKITAPLFELGGTAAALRNAKAQKQLAITQYEKVIQSAFREVSDELTNRRAISVQLANQQKVLKAQESAYQTAENRFKIGLGRQNVALEAKKLYLQTALTNIELVRQQQSNRIMLYKVLGGGAVE